MAHRGRTGGKKAQLCLVAAAASLLGLTYASASLAELSSTSLRRETQALGVRSTRLLAETASMIELALLGDDGEVVGQFTFAQNPEDPGLVEATLNLGYMEIKVEVFADMAEYRISQGREFTQMRFDAFSHEWVTVAASSDLSTMYPQEIAMLAELAATADPGRRNAMHQIELAQTATSRCQRNEWP